MLSAAGDAFTEAMGVGLAVGAVLSAAMALLVVRLLPSPGLTALQVEASVEGAQG